MKLRIYTIYNYLDITTKNDIEFTSIVSQLEEGSTILLELDNGNKFTLNNINVLAIEMVTDNTPPISK